LNELNILTIRRCDERRNVLTAIVAARRFVDIVYRFFL